LNYVETQNDDRLAGQSFLVKWAALLLGVFIYTAYHWLRAARLRSRKNKDSDIKLNKVGKINSFTDSPDGEEDPFHALRSKEKLRSRAEIMIEKENRSP
jgi:hypothetical protein